MPNPKRRHTKTRKHKRRSHHALEIPNLVECPKCHAYKLPHRICSNCGSYDGIVYFLSEEKRSKS